METKNFSIHETTAIGPQLVHIPCSNWQVDKPTTVRIRKKPYFILPPPRSMADSRQYYSMRISAFAGQFDRLP